MLNDGRRRTHQHAASEEAGGLLGPDEQAMFPDGSLDALALTRELGAVKAPG
jgi:hypothetical protein